MFVGTHDFLSFSKSALSNTTRTINAIKIVNKKGLIEIYINGNGFLRNMVRMIIGSLIDLNENNFNTMKKEQVARLIEDNAIIMADGYGYELKKDDLYSTILSKLTPKS